MIKLPWYYEGLSVALRNILPSKWDKAFVFFDESWNISSFADFLQSALSPNLNHYTMFVILIADAEENGL